MLIGAQQDDIEHIIGLELGADDYIARPFNERVLVARVKALLWRLGTGGRAGEQTGFKRFEGWQLDMTSHRLISPKGEDIPLTHGEFELLAHFVQNPGRVLTRDQLLNVVSSREPSPSDRTVDVLVSRLRHKIERDPKAPKIFVTVHGLGYRFSAKVEGRGTAVTTHGSRQ